MISESLMPSVLTPEAREEFLRSAADELTALLPQLQIVLGKIQAAQRISAELLAKRIDL